MAEAGHKRPWRTSISPPESRRHLPGSRLLSAVPLSRRRRNLRRNLGLSVSIFAVGQPLLPIVPDSVLQEGDGLILGQKDLTYVLTTFVVVNHPPLMVAPKPMELVHHRDASWIEIASFIGVRLSFDAPSAYIRRHP